MQNFCIPEDKKPLMIELRTLVNETLGKEAQLKDDLLYRYLYVFDFDMKKSCKHVIKMLEWRKENNMDTLLDNEEAKKVEYELSRQLMYKLHGYDKFGRPTTYINIGRCDLRFLMKNFKQQDILNAHLYYDELVDKQSHEMAKQKGVDYIGNCTVVDLKGLSIYKHMDVNAVSLLAKIVDIYSNYYPETADLVLVLHTPSIFSFFWSIISPFFSELQKKKLHLLKDEKELLNYFDISTIPSIYGGECVCQGGCVIGKTDEKGNIHSDIIKIGSGKQHFINLTCEENETISWTFRSLHKDIAFGVVFTPEDPSITKSILWQTNRVNAHEEIISGSYTTYCKGTVQLIFDNSYSKMTAKTIAYDIIRSFDE